MKQLIILILILSAAVFAQQSRIKIAGGNGESFFAPQYSPDGTKIAFTSDNYKGIWIYNYSDKSIIQLTDETASGFGFTWSQDSRYILSRVAEYEQMRRFNAVKIFDVATKESQNLSGYRLNMPVLPQWSSGDSKVVTYTKQKEEYSTGRLAKAGAHSRSALPLGSKIILGDSQKILEPFKDAELLNLSLSPDGNKIVFEVMGGNMFVINYDGSGLTDIGKGNRPKWSPDSKSLVYMLTKDDGHVITESEILIVNSDGSGRKQLTNTSDLVEMNPSFSPDGKIIAFDEINEGAIYIFKID
jgi:Tol biopolymer transport system component